MSLKDEKYKVIRSEIRTDFNTLRDWEKVRKFAQYTENTDIPLSHILQMTSVKAGLAANELTEDLWNELVSDVEKEYEISNPVIMGDHVKSTVSVPTEKFSSWKIYIDNLEKKGWAESAIINIEKSATHILERLSQDTQGREANKGLVVGDVQSGKTANMAGLMAMAADHGYNFFIILSGVIENLREQTSNRLYKDLRGSGQPNISWTQVSKPSLRNRDYDISNFNLNNKNAYFTVSLKNSSRLRDLEKWLFSDKNKTKQLKVLVIDDEADQASINTKRIEEEKSKINELILNIVGNRDVRAMNYIAYTATPYANVLNETGPNTLYPKDFITVLPTSNDYIGPNKLFGELEPEKNPPLDIVNIIDKKESDHIRLHNFNNMSKNFPEDLAKSVNWFLISLAMGKILKLNMPISMLVHSSMKIVEHKEMSELILNYLKHLRHNYRNMKYKLNDLYNDQKNQLSRENFLNAMDGYSNPESVMQYPSWSEIEMELDRLMDLSSDNYVSHIDVCDEGVPRFHEGIHLVIDNSSTDSLFDEQENFRLVYPTKEEDLEKVPGFIVVGGNTLSRGLTLEGLSSTYFIRNTSQVDTLMQMGRWFGYRKGYELFPRIWMDYTSLRRFSEISQINKELKEEIKIFSEEKVLPISYAPRVKNSSNHNILRITSNNKMQSAIATTFNFSGFNSQTIYFKNDIKQLEENLNNTRCFLNEIPNKTEFRESHLIWRNVSSENVAEYLKSFHFNDLDLKMQSIPQLIEWILDDEIELTGWNVILSGLKGNVKDSSYKWDINGYKTRAVRRSKIISRSTDEIANIGALRAPSDLLIDLKDKISNEEFKESRAPEVINIRKKYGLERTPLLIIYRIDKGIYDGKEKYSKNNDKRGPLNFPVDIIGLNILIPGDGNNSSFATSISAKLNYGNVDDVVYEEEE